MLISGLVLLSRRNAQVEVIWLTHLLASHIERRRCLLRFLLRVPTLRLPLRGRKVGTPMLLCRR